MVQDDYLTIPELAARWKVSVPTVRRLLSRGAIKKLYIGRQVRVARSEVDFFEQTWNAGTDRAVVEIIEEVKAGSTDTTTPAAKRDAESRHESDC